MSGEFVVCPDCGEVLQASTEAIQYWCPKCKKYVPYGKEKVIRTKYINKEWIRMSDVEVGGK